MIRKKSRRTQLLFLAVLPFFNFVFARAEDAAQPDWKKYHKTAEVHALLESWTNRYPGLTKLYSIGETLKGTPLMVLEITNKETGKAGEKPGYYYDGNIHAGELTGAEVVLHFAWHVLSNFGKDDRITKLVNTHTLYIRPKFNPDGADIALTTPHSLRSTPRPYDEDRDGRLDEDPADDLNGDGAITRMRIQNPNGVWKVSPSDKRIMVRREETDFDGTFYDLHSEGIDDDHDGQFNEDGIGGIDMNRNFPRNWGLEFEQRGAGPYPLSEPETRATIEFLNSHRNISGVFHGHTSGGFLFRLPSTTAWDNFDLSDQRLILELSEKYASTTDQPIRPSYSNPRVHRHGTLISWSYWDFGVVAFVPEFWGGFGRDYDDSGEVSEVEKLRWNQEEMKGSGFIEWRPFEHPQLGQVEIGGWKTKFTRQNPPPHLLKREIEKYVPWMVWLAEISPRVTIKETFVKPIGTGKVAKVTAVVANEGYLPTNITQRALDADIAVPVRANVSVQDGLLVSGEAYRDIGHLQGSRENQISRGSVGSRKVLEYVLLITGPNPVFTITVISEKGGMSVREIQLSRHTKN